MNRPFDILEIPVYLGATSLFLIQLFGFAPYFDKKYLSVLPSVSYLPSGLLLTGIGLLSMCFGYTLVSSSFKPDASKNAVDARYNNPSLQLTFLLYLSVFALRLGLIALGSGEIVLGNNNRVGGNWYQWFVYLIELRWFFIALVTLQVAAGRWPRWLLVFVVLIEGGMAVSSGWSSSLPKIVLLVSGCLIYVRQRLRWRTLLLVAIGAIAVVIFSVPIARDLRETRRATEQVAWANIYDSFEMTWGAGFGNGWKLFSNLIVGRQTVIAQTPSILIRLIPGVIPYLPWQELAVAPLTSIPRVIWSSKPIYSEIGTWLTVQVFGRPQGSGSSAITIVGNAYMYGGWSVVVIGMLVLGVLAGSMYRWLAIPGLLNNQVGLLAVYAGVVISNFHLGEGDYVSIWQGLTQRAVVFLAVTTILCMKSNVASVDDSHIQPTK